MAILTNLSGVGPNGEILTATVEVEVTMGGMCADFTVTNTSVLGLIDQFLFNLNSDFDSTVAGELVASNIVPNTWEFEDSSDAPTNGFDHNSGGCGMYQYRMDSKVADDRLGPGESLTFTLCSTDNMKLFDDNTFLNAPDAEMGMGTLPFQLAVSFQQLINGDSDCIAGRFGEVPPPTTTVVPTTTVAPTTTAAPVCPVANPQTCCQVVVEFKTQLVPPALASGIGTIRTISAEVIGPVIEGVCPEKVIVCGKVRKVFEYTAVMDDGSLDTHEIIDERAFQCVIDRDDANAGDVFEVVGAAILCEGTPRVQNSGRHKGPGDSTVDVFWKVVEKDIIKVCIRKAE